MRSGAKNEANGEELNVGRTRVAGVVGGQVLVGDIRSWIAGEMAQRGKRTGVGVGINNQMSASLWPQRANLSIGIDTGAPCMRGVASPLASGCCGKSPEPQHQLR